MQATNPLILTLVLTAVLPFSPKYQPAGSRLGVLEVAMLMVTRGMIRSELAVSNFVNCTKLLINANLTKSEQQSISDSDLALAIGDSPCLDFA